MRKKLEIIAFSLFALLACKQPMPGSATESETTTEEETTSTRIILGDSLQRIDFDTFSLLVDRIDMGWDGMFQTKNDSVCTATGDTVELQLYAGDWFYGRKMRIAEETYKIRRLSCRIIDQIGVNSNRIIEVPFCVPEGWKQKSSKWINVPPKKGHFLFDFEDTTAPPQFTYTVEEFRNAVQIGCGDEWYEEMTAFESLEDLPVRIFTTEYLFKIEVENTQTHERLVKYIRFYTPQSC